MDVLFLTLMKQSLLTFYFVFISLCSFGQIGGRATYQFLNLENSTRHVALGGKVVTDNNNNPISALYNPATLNEKMVKNFAISYVNYIADINYGAAATAFSVGRSKEHLIHVGIIYADYGDFDGFDLEGNSTGEFGAAETAVSLGYARRIPNSDFYLGANLKFISSRLEQYSSVGIATDLGVLYYKKEWDLNIGLAVRNLGTQITTYTGTQEKLPLAIDAGISQIPKNIPVRWFVNLQNLQFWQLAFSNSNRDTEDLFGEPLETDDPSFINNVLRHVTLGVEMFPRSAINLRLGYNFRRSEELKIIDQRSFAGLSAGASIRIKKLTFSYSYARFNLAGSSSLLGLNLNLGNY